MTDGHTDHRQTGSLYQVSSPETKKCGYSENAENMKIQQDIIIEYHVAGMYNISIFFGNIRRENYLL